MEPDTKTEDDKVDVWEGGFFFTLALAAFIWAVNTIYDAIVVVTDYLAA